jgi:DNA helicase-2/ATP-dependent DNA helicase PcrA
MSDPSPQPGSITARALAARGGAVTGTNAPWLEGLNPEQQRAVETLDGPVLVLAGAGTGKTRVLTTRIAHILGTGRASPGQIMAVTFTNKAAREMKQRIGGMIGSAVEGMPWLGTFHAIGTRILRYHAELAGLKSSFTILDTDDQIRLLKQLIQAENIDEKRWPARQLAAHIDRWKNRGLLPEQVPASDGVFANGRGVELYEAYQERMAVLNAVDFGDLLVKPIKLFTENPDILADYHRRFKFLLVDEYQDTNVAQYLWLRLLAQGTDDAKPNICCVGDDDQSIYGWRGAEVDNILRFERDFPGATVIRLERNYRSTSSILATASHLIAHNEDRLGKTLFTDVADQDDEEKVTVTEFNESSEEARSICDDIEVLEKRGHPLNEMAILVRTSAQMREFEDRFFTLGLSYRVVGGPRFYERKEIRDALAYLRVVAQPDDGMAFERIVNVPKRGLGDTTVAKIGRLSRDTDTSPFAAARTLCDTEELGVNVRSKLRGLIDDFDRWRSNLDTLPHTELAEIVLDESGYTEMWMKDTSPQAPGRLENLKELISSMEEFENLNGFLEHIALVMDTEGSEQEDAVTLMTLHAAKGLEFDTVFLPGWEKDLFPSKRSIDENGDAGLEEERRLAYVGITRARKRAKISFARNRFIYGTYQHRLESPFIAELPDQHIEIAAPTSQFGSYGSQGYGNYGASRFDKPLEMDSAYQTPGWKRAQAARSTGKRPSSGPMTIEGELVARSVSTKASGFALGDRVFHQKFGYGDVAMIEGNKLTIDFDKAGRKKVVESFVTPHNQAG